MSRQQLKRRTARRARPRAMARTGTRMSNRADGGSRCRNRAETTIDVDERAVFGLPGDGATDTVLIYKSNRTPAIKKGQRYRQRCTVANTRLSYAASLELIGPYRPPRPVTRPAQTETRRQRTCASLLSPVSSCSRFSCLMALQHETHILRYCAGPLITFARVRSHATN